ncbi:Por secretion system C-terminal sorting domain-containing protein [Chitinophaga eiseniae]|uniref:Por secretion system C-terminal sorting domain-containing protein n=1 Tax=Chitinophaga eiseniae TaxID=634771 RepID=A0A1T4TUS8_9BACT|nr:T9SS type A sorting domain-containing protein [Chitinophaga eiseniae]SKA44235.1 Por secretion system C-terminal sorting domain-containing protein [Chitinophaga eiseniae]
MKSTILFCFASLFSMLAQAQVTGPTTVCPNTQYTYSYVTTRPYNTISYTVIGGFGIVEPTGAQCYIKFPDDQPIKPRVVADIRWADGSQFRDTSQAITVRGIGRPIEYTTLTRSFPCSFRGATTITVDNIPNADSVYVSNDAGWPVTRISNHQFTMNINNGAQGNVSIVAKNDSCNKFRASTVAITRPKPAIGNISGPGVICNSGAQTLSVAAYPSVTSYTWTADNPNIRINGQPSPVTITGASGNNVSISSAGGDYQASLKVFAVGECGASDTAVKTLGTGTPPINFIMGFPRNGIHFAGGQTYEFSVGPPANYGNVLDIDWTVIGGTIESYHNDKKLIYVQMNNVSGPTLPGSVSMYVKWKNECGWSTELHRTGTLDSGGGSTFTVSPNPAGSYVSIDMSGTSAATLKTSAQDAAVIILYDMYYKEIKRMRLTAGARKAMMNVQDVKDGTYIMQVITGKEKQSKVVIVSHSL